MSYDINVPQITANTDAGKIEQIRSYLYQLADQLKFALNAIDNGVTSAVHTISSSKSNSVAEAEDSPKSTFNSIKALIIKSADIVESYYEEFNQRFSGEYVAQSDFGTYTEETALEIKAASDGVTQLLESKKQIESDIDEIQNDLLTTKDHIKTGKIGETAEGYDLIGIEIGQTNKDSNGEEVFNKYAQFTSDKLSFFDRNGIEVAYISDYKLYIREAEIKVGLQEGGYKDFIDEYGGIVTKWVGRN